MYFHFWKYLRSWLLQLKKSCTLELFLTYFLSYIWYFFFVSVKCANIYFSNPRQMSIETCQTPAGSSNPDDKFGFGQAEINHQTCRAFSILLSFKFYTTLRELKCVSLQSEFNQKKTSRYKDWLAVRTLYCF
jgi:hypothetical protein